MKKIFLALLLCVATCLAGCGDGGGSTGKTAEQPVMLDYYNAEAHGVINGEGTMIVEPRFGSFTSILVDENRRQRFCLDVETIYPEGEAADDDGYRIAGKNFRFYDPWGKLVHEQRIDMPRIARGDDVEFWLAKDGGLENGCFLLNTFTGDGGYHIYGIDGSELVAKQVYGLDEPLRYAYVYMELGDGFMIVNYECAFDGQADGYGADVYTTTGEPVTMPRDYVYLWSLWDFVEQRSSGYYVARYWDGERYLCDLLDDRLQVVISGAEGFDSYGGGVVTVNMDGAKGLMNMQGEWLYQE